MADTAYQAALTEVEEYRFDSGEGSQRVRNRQLAEFQNITDFSLAQIKCILPCIHQFNGFCQDFKASMALGDKADGLRDMIKDTKDCEFYNEVD